MWALTDAELTKFHQIMVWRQIEEYQVCTDIFEQQKHKPNPKHNKKKKCIPFHKSACLG